MANMKEKILVFLIFLGVAAAYIGLSALAPEFPADAAAADQEDCVTGGMPCEDPEAFKRWYEDYSTSSEEVCFEQETDKEGASDAGVQNDRSLLPTDEEETEADAAALEAADQECAAGEAPDGEVCDEPERTLVYQIAGELIDPGIQRKLYKELDAAGIAYWYTGALAQMFQESHGKIYAENPNGLDKGVYQFRITYWDWNDGDIFDPDVQIRRYVRETAARLNAGLSVDEVISRHKTSDAVTAIDTEYVRQVRQWLGKMEVVE